MAKKKDTEIEVVDTAEGVAVRVGKRTVAEIKEEFGSFVVTAAGKEVAVVKDYADALEEAIKAYNLTV